MRNARIWVLIADAASARICSTKDGTATAIDAGTGAIRGLDTPGKRDETLCRAWFRAEGHNSFSAGPVRRFALHLGQILKEGAREKAYDHLIVIAAPDIAGHLEQVLAPETRALLVGEVVRDLRPAGISPVEIREELWH